MFIRLIAALLLFHLPVVVFSQYLANHFIKNYNRKDYQASIANFGITKDSNGIIYVANYNGVLLFNGQNWNVVNLPSSSTAYSIASDTNDRVFVNLKDDFGYLTADKKGNLEFISLAKEVPGNIKVSGISKIISTEAGVYFFSKEVIFLLDNNGTITSIEAGMNSFGYTLHELNGKATCIQENVGLISFISDTPDVLFQHEIIPNTSPITYISHLSHDTLVLGTASNGLYKMANGQSLKVSTDISQYLSSNTLYTGAIIEQGDSSIFAFGTFKNGVIISDNHLKGFSIVNKNTGLQSNMIRGLTMDKNSGLWTAMQEGISRIEINSPWKHWNEEDGVKGTPWDIIRFNNTLYVGTTTGLYFMQDNLFLPVVNLSSKIWSLGTINKKGVKTLLAGSESGLYEIVNNTAEKILHIPGITKIYTPPQSPEKIIVASNNGISEVFFHDGYYEKNLINVPRHTFSSIYKDKKGDIWVSSKAKGIYHIYKQGDQQAFQLYDKKNGLPDVNDIMICSNAGKPLFFTNHGVYSILRSNNEKSLIFASDTTLFPDGTNINTIAQNKNGNYIASVVTGGTVQTIGRIFKNRSGEYKHEITPYKRLPEMEIIAIYPEDNGITWIAGSEGLFRYDENVKKDYTLPFNTVVSKVNLADSTIFHGFYPKEIEGSDIPGISIEQPKSYIPTLTFDNNNITFEYSATFYEVPEKNQFSYYLANNDKGWSNWSYETKKEYTNLAPGKYTFHVKSKNIYDTEGKTATYQFVILAPWYRTSWAYAGFSLLGGGLIWLITMAYSLRVRIQRKKLRLIVADRTYEVMSQKKEIENQNALLKTKNEEISKQKDDIEFKNRQLQDSQEEILNMNQKLTELNTYLEKKVEKRTSKIKATLKELQKINLELDTFVYRASHDLKGPISRINGITSLAKLESPDTINLKYFNLIEETAKDMGVLLSKLAQVHEIINTRVDKEEIDIPSLLSEVREEVKFLDKGRNTKYAFDLQAIMLNSDRYLLGIIIKNLVENALVFRKNPEKEPHHIQISTSSSKGTFCLKIRDNGIGIQSEHTSKVFQMFFRGSDKSKGSGLGLYLVKMCLDKLGAAIALESKENEFTEFTIEIPT
ncbi:hypothetical protein C900_03986 [Fulvivirga imtechensis AK7]|uniref:histidine kinase n=1 Tax=Fulvivirga imtechensis AK7 TaxID=1237149 RepID=L8JN04_9BACT|nr:sensor histidine kinase [Fulvivirga imtechensis]ELR70301.1 hypothetical protein C900_03986 [Fulvivirga imtechensis AK7]